MAFTEFSISSFLNISGGLYFLLKSALYISVYV